MGKISGTHGDKETSNSDLGSIVMGLAGAVLGVAVATILPIAAVGPVYAVAAGGISGIAGYTAGVNGYSTMFGNGQNNAKEH